MTLSARSTLPNSERTKTRKGFTLIEMMVAIMLLAIGMLGLAGFSLAAAKQARGASVQEVAALVVQSRLDSVASVQCKLLAPGGQQTGTVTTRGVTEKWVIDDGNDIKTIVDTVTFATRKNKLTYKSIIPCRD